MRPHLKPAPSAAGFASLVFLAACSTIQPPAVSNGHLHAESIPSAAVSRDIPAPVATAITLPRPTASAKTETYSVSVRNIPVQDLLFALSRDAKINVDVHPGINGVVTINAIDQTLQQILTRIAKQVDMRWEIDGPNLIVMPDSPFLHTYKVDYVNMLRDVSSSVSINTQIASTSSGTSTNTSTGGGNNSTTTVTSKAQNNFWPLLKKTSKISCAKQTKFCLKVPAKPSSNTRINKKPQEQASHQQGQLKVAKEIHRRSQEALTLPVCKSKGLLSLNARLFVKRRPSLSTPKLE